jgi:hypothetical protein
MIPTSRNYQRKHLRAPYKGPVLFADEDFVFKCNAINISEGGLLLDQMPHFPGEGSVPLMLSIPQFPYFKNFSLLKMQTFSHDLFAKKIIRAKAIMVRREQAVQSIDNIFRSRFGLMFSDIELKDQKIIDDYVTTFASNLVYLQTMIDSFNTDDEMKFKTRALATILGYKDVEKIALLRALVTHDYRSLQWL